ncbi:hypothetical protein LQ948_08385 [Jiella sp. MQZ9-1]|uniref:Uncharacterized protein n=1 Tax=Jiella flava TaxID=2816857 RepID=A0A939G0H5_9HYPH|nr:hypothetical protein [Jiella flava]MBO0662804.1 hypothetical protein [Jiella flava]MCD2471225.1 hypothetical protein [Jiella flava]
MLSESAMQLSPSREAAHFLVSSLSAVRGVSREAANMIELAIWHCDDRLVIPERSLPRHTINRNALLHALNYAIPELEHGSPEAAAAVSLAVTILAEETGRQNQ